MTPSEVGPRHEPSRAGLPPYVAYAALGVDASVGVVTAAVRAAAVTVVAVHDELRVRGLPSDWEGRASEAAGAVVARVGRDCDAVGVALEVALRGLRRYETEVAGLVVRHERLMHERLVLNAEVDEARRTPSLPATTTTGLDDRAGALWVRHAALLAALDRLLDDLEQAQERLVRALAAVDTVREAVDAVDRRGGLTVPGVPAVLALARGLRGRAGDPDAVRSWWGGLGARERLALSLARPGLVGRTDGIPLRERDAANTAVLQGDLDRLETITADGRELDARERWLAESAAATRDALRRGVETLDPTTGEPIAPLLLLYRPGAFGGDGGVAIAYGDPDTADNTVVMVPGLGTDLRRAESLGRDALSVYEAAATADPRATPAVVTWLGYDAPSFSPHDLGDWTHELDDAAGVMREETAERGGHRLADFVDGLRATDRDDPSCLTVVGHSYGSTTAAHGAADGLDTDLLVLVGSPGAGGGVTDADGLHLTPGHVFVGAADNDPVTWLGGEGRIGLGEDPAQADFGAVRFPVAPGPTFHLDELDVGFDTHSSYYDPGSGSLHQIAAIVDGQVPETVPGRDEPAHDHLLAWVGQEAVHLPLALAESAGHALRWWP